MEPGAKCFAVRSLGWVEVPEEDLVPGKSSIAVNNCIQQLAQTRSRGQPPDGAWGEGQNMLMILKKDAMSLVNPLDHSLIHCQPLVHIRVWGVGSSKGRSFDMDPSSASPAWSSPGWGGWAPLRKDRWGRA